MRKLTIATSPAVPSAVRLVKGIASFLRASDWGVAGALMDQFLRQGCAEPSSKQPCSSLLHTCAKCAGPDAAGVVVEHLVSKGATIKLVTFNAIIDECAQAMDMAKAKAWFDQMPRAGIRPCRITYNTMIKACPRAGATADAEAWLRRMIDEGISPCLRTFGVIVNIFAKTTASTWAGMRCGHSGELVLSSTTNCDSVPTC